MEEKIISREVIQGHAVELFHEKGVDATSINELVKTCGIAKGTFYLYFRDKDDLVESVFDRYRQNFIQEVIDKNKAIHKVTYFADSLIEYFNENQMFLIEIRKHMSTYKKYDYIEKTVKAFTKVIVNYLKFYEEYTVKNIDIYNQALIVMILEICYQGIIDGSCDDKEEAKKILCDVFKRFFGCN